MAEQRVIRRGDGRRFSCCNGSGRIETERWVVVEVEICRFPKKRTSGFPF